MQVKEGSYATENKNRPKNGWNSTYTNEETDHSKLKSSQRILTLRSYFFNQISNEDELLKRSS